MDGLKLAALFGLYPHKLGFCGSGGAKSKKVLSDFLSGKKVPEQKIKNILQGFEGAFPYYKLIAKSNNIKSPFDERVVRAYWIGNELLEKVSITDLANMIAEEFSKRGLLGKKTAEKKAKIIPSSSKPHHSFHVLVIGSVTGRVALKGKLLDLCRVSWGRVLKKLKIKNDTPKELLCNPTGQELKILIEHQPLIKKKSFTLARPVQKEIFWDKDFVPNIRVGDMIAMHWNHVVQVLSKKDVALLKKYTYTTIRCLQD